MNELKILITVVTDDKLTDYQKIDIVDRFASGFQGYWSEPLVYLDRCNINFKILKEE